MESTQAFETGIAERMKSLRLAQAMTLDDLATRAGVSRAMISRIERGEASPTAQLLARLCSALGTTLSRFFATEETVVSPLSRRNSQRIWRDPETGYLRRSVSPDGTGSPVDIVEVEFPPGARVVFEQQQFDASLTQHLWLFEGRLTMTAGAETYVLEAGDCLFMRLAEAHIFHNPHGEPARYAVILNRSKV
ncbi:helix-turn-helix domain-containing protein [Rhizobium herbae]|uniref:Transcriptional regulator with XRE-family HTH domain n=1 Tax=Rhizobium herbae TaxID=508661 RepID=A0ABS4EID9_9HYPH|nr:XRE family transcriptional regulator [Rhizobium herbae]MBP1857712.1 transcriptional regulator with XRE-family HTH domain [Rhizobium herbae]